jgi:hypothetical protein
MNQIQKLNQTEYSNYYSVFDKNGRKICDASSIEDALMMCSFDSTRTYKQVKIILDQIVNVPFTRMEDDKQLKEQKILNESNSKPFKP